MHMLRKTLGIGLLGSVFAASLAAQRTWVVDLVAGPGVDFTDIPPAVAAAAAGDRIVVRGSTVLAPTYSSFVVGKSLDIEATQGASVDFFRVENLTSGMFVTVAGLRCRPQPTFLTQDECVMVRNCAGAVTFRNLTITPVPADVYGSFYVRDSRAVAIQDCHISGRSQGLFTGGQALAVERSGVSIANSTLAGGNGGGSASSAVGLPGGQGLAVDGGSVFVTGSTVSGGDGGLGWVWSGNGVSAVYVVPSTTSSLELAGCTLIRGVGVANGEAVDGIARVTSDCLVTGGLVNGALLVPPITMLTAGPSVPVGGTVPVAVSGAAGTVFAVAFDLLHGHQSIAGIIEPLLLSPGPTVGAFGSLTTSPWTWNLPIPNSPLLARRELYFQAVAAGAGGLTLTPLAITRLR